MAKKITFKHINQELINTVNLALKVNFANAYERKMLASANKLAMTRLEEAQDKGNKKGIDSYTRELRVIKYKRAALQKWTNTTLRAHKNNSDVWEDGLFEAMGVTKELVQVWADCKADNTWTKWNKAIKDMLVSVYEISVDDKLINKFASYLEHIVGDKLAGTNQILKGQMLRTETVKNAQAILVWGIATYMAKTCDSIEVPTSEFYQATVEYDKNYGTVVDWNVFPVDVKEDSQEESAEEPGQEESDKASAKAEKLIKMTVARGASQSEEESAKKALRKQFEKMTVADLREFAKKHNISLKTRMKRADIIAKLCA